MIRLGIVSDSHDYGDWLERWLALSRERRYDAVFHLGDYHSDARWLERRLDVPMYCVAGNCDTFSKAPRMVRATYGGHTLLAVHGHLQDVKYRYDTLSYYAEENGADIALFGHTHRPYTGYEGRVLLLNPGALMNGRYAELLIDGDRVVPYLLDLRDKDGANHR